jgi:hypothetical protein
MGLFKIGIVGLVVAMLVGCSSDCGDRRYDPFTIEIFTQQINTSAHRFPPDLEWLLDPVQTNDAASGTQCFCPGNGIDSQRQTPFVTVERIDSGAPAPWRMSLVPGLEGIPTYREYESMIGEVVDSLVLPYAFQVRNRTILPGALESKVSGASAVFFYEAHNQGEGIDSLTLNDKRYKIYRDAREVRLEIEKLLTRYAQNHGARSDVAGIDYGPKIAFFYNLDWAAIVAEPRARIRASAYQALVNDTIFFEDVSNPVDLMVGGTWDFGDGAHQPYQQRVSHVYALGNYKVRLCDRTGDLCDSFPIEISSPPPPPPQCDSVVVKIGPHPAVVTTCGPINFTDLSQVDTLCYFARVWRIDGTVVGRDAVLDHQFKTPGFHRVRLCRGDSCVESKVQVVEPTLDYKLTWSFTDTTITWSNQVTGLSYEVSISNYDDPQHIYLKKTQTQGWVRLPKSIQAGALCRINVLAIGCDRGLDTITASFNAISRHRRIIIDPTCQIQKR